MSVLSVEQREVMTVLAGDMLTEIARVGRRPTDRRRQARVIEDVVFAAGGCVAKLERRELTPRERAAMTRIHLRMTDRYLYAIQAGEDGPIKIGQTINPAGRLATLQQANWLELRGVAAWRATRFDEKALHDQFAQSRIRGEWFEPTPELVETVLWLGGEFCDWKPLTEVELEELEATWTSE